MVHNASMTISLLLVCQGVLIHEAAGQTQAHETNRVVLSSDGWRLIGDLSLPTGARHAPAVLMLNKAAGDRTVYEPLAVSLAGRGIASLRIDLRGHGESINMGRFVPGEPALLVGSEDDVAAAHEYLRSHPRIDGSKVAVVGGSYSGEAMAEAGREYGYAQAYVALSPGSFSERSFATIDSTGIPWLFVKSRDERFLVGFEATLLEMSETAEIIIVPGAAHASDLLVDHPDLVDRLAVWLAHRLGGD